MLLQLILDHPSALGTILQNTPVWVWGVLAGLTALGASQMADRTVGLARSVLMPLAMAGLSLLGIASAFGRSGHTGAAIGAWLVASVAAAALALWRQPEPAAGARYVAEGGGRFFIRGSAVPLALILGIFFTKYLVGVELAMQPALAEGSGFALQIGALYGAFSGLFAARSLRLWRLVPRRAMRTA